MANTDPLTDFTQLVSENTSSKYQISPETPTKAEQYLKELELNTFQTRQLFDQLLEEQDSPNFISTFQKDQRIMNTLLQLSDQQNVTSLTDIPNMSYMEVQKTRKIFKQKKTSQKPTHHSDHFGLVPREKRRQVGKMAYNRLRFRIQQNDQKQKPIQTTHLNKRSGGKINESQVELPIRNTNQSCDDLFSEGKFFSCEQFQNYLNLS